MVNYYGGGKIVSKDNSCVGTKYANYVDHCNIESKKIYSDATNINCYHEIDMVNGKRFRQNPRCEYTDIKGKTKTIKIKGAPMYQYP